MSWFKKLFGNKEAVSVNIEPKKKSDSILIDKEKYNKSHEVVLQDSPGPTESKPEPEVRFVEPSALTEMEKFDLMKVNFEDAANQSGRKNGKVLGICLHHIMMGTFEQNVNFLKSKESGVSAHYCLGREGELTQMVNTSKKSWHAGVGEYVIGGIKRSNLNEYLVGIEIVNPGVVTKNRKGQYIYNCGGKNTAWDGAEPVEATIVYPSGKTLTAYSVPYPEKQISKLVSLCKALVEKYPHITRNDIVAHYQIAQPEGRKNDPFGLDLENIKNLIFGS